jgi:release factor glutamine methyltransferase
MSPDRTHEVERVIAAHRERQYDERHTYLGHSITIVPSVFSPFIAPSGYLSLALSGMPLFKDRRVLDVGCGAGILACMAAASGAQHVIGVDISKSAVKNANENAKAVNVCQRTSFHCGDLFDPVARQETFDIVFADLPFTDGKPADDLDRAFFDPGLRSIREFVAQLPDYLNGDGAFAVLCWSDLDDMDISPIVRRANLHADVFMEVRLKWVTLRLLQLRRGRPR